MSNPPAAAASTSSNGVALSIVRWCSESGRVAVRFRIGLMILSRRHDLIPNL